MHHGNRINPYPVSQSWPTGPRSTAAACKAALIPAALHVGCRDHHRAAKAAACGAAADVPENGRSRHRHGNGTTATKSGLGRREFGPHELYGARLPLGSTAPTATTRLPSAGKATLPPA